jgi:hypothetical protein
MGSNLDAMVFDPIAARRVRKVEVALATEGCQNLGLQKGETAP